MVITIIQLDFIEEKQKIFYFMLNKIQISDINTL